MSLPAKITWIGVGLIVVILISFAIWGSAMESAFSQQAAMERFRAAPSVGWLVGIALLVSDLFLPVPATPVMAALGAVYGVGLGTAIAATGSVLAGVLGYVLARWARRPMRRWLGTEAERARFQAFFDRYGAIGIIASRAVPILPEVLTVLAGLARMHVGRFLAALIVGTVPSALLFAYIGHAAAAEAWWVVFAVTAIPMILWIAMLLLARRARDDRKAPDDAPPP